MYYLEFNKNKILWLEKQQKTSHIPFIYFIFINFSLFISLIFKISN